ncbi:putative alcohol dehydrogenase [Dactylonectria estremocensis]|uniref:Alcohol dehydrogenase n=1 Tax=Dactylonectria estremocensis TaxID=1079267 RepID=A0A9P9ISU0_9HYPO|nr:putative alcohol dehydrogenase [Dactylonectria estremocensis]
MLPSTAEALVVRVDGDKLPTLVKELVPVPTPGEHQVLVKVSHVAQNPTDIQSFERNAFGDGAILGCDFVGTVEQTGPNVSRISETMTIAGLVWGGEVKGLGGYSQYSLADERICFPVPEGISLEQAATVPLATVTALLALFSKECLNIETNARTKTTVLIWGGSSSVGLYAIQIAAMYGLDVVTTCSPRHHNIVRSLGAGHTFDYRGTQVVNKIKQAAPGLRYVFDTIGNETSAGLASQAIDEAGGVLCTVRPSKTHTEKVTKQTKVTSVMMWTSFLKEHRYENCHWPVNQADHKLAVDFFAKLPQLLSDGTIKPNSTKVFKDGLDGVHEGFQEYRDGKISNYKIVYKLNT